jgi:hypothetical protein
MSTARRSTRDRKQATTYVAGEADTLPVSDAEDAEEDGSELSDEGEASPESSSSDEEDGDAWDMSGKAAAKKTGGRAAKSANKSAVAAKGKGRKAAAGAKTKTKKQQTKKSPAAKSKAKAKKAGGKKAGGAKGGKLTAAVAEEAEDSDASDSSDSSDSDSSDEETGGKALASAVRGGANIKVLLSDFFDKCRKDRKVQWGRVGESVGGKMRGSSRRGRFVGCGEICVGWGGGRGQRNNGVLP